MLVSETPFRAHFLTVLSKFFVNENEVSVVRFFNPLRIKLFDTKDFVRFTL